MSDKGVDWSASVATELKERLDSLEKKLEEYSDYMVKVRRIQQDNTKQRTDLYGTDDSMVYHPDQSTEPEKYYIKDYIARFEVLQGRWGMYFHDSKRERSLTLNEVESLLNIYYAENLKLIEEIQGDLLSIFECPTLECVKALCNQYIEKWQGRIK